MAIPRRKQINIDVTRWYHCISQVVRQSSLLGESRKEWIENRLEFLSSIFAISVGGFATLDTHFHTLVRIDKDESESWKAKEVADRWFSLFPPKKRGKLLAGEDLEKHVAKHVRRKKWIKERRTRLCSVSWFMKELKQPLACMANSADNCRGAFWAGRFKSIAIVDNEALLFATAYIDLNVVAAGLADFPEESEHTSVKARVDHATASGRKKDLAKAKLGSVEGCKASAGLEEKMWLVPIEDRRTKDGSTREGICEQFTLGNYLMLVEYMGRRRREGKASIPSEAADLFCRLLGDTALAWMNRVHDMLASNQLIGRTMASTSESLSMAQARYGATRLANVGA